jgi:trimethylamine--corrinoid protein Co-methyltransferase
MITNKNRLRILDNGDIEQIHGATLEVLEKVGVSVDSSETLDILKANGFEVVPKSKIVKMSESKVIEAVRSCKRNFRWHARNEKHSIDIVDGRTKFGPGSQCLYYIEPDSEHLRAATLQDGINICRLLDALDSSALGYIPVYPSDVPVPAMSVVMWAAGLVNSSKPAFGSSGGGSEFEMMLRIADMFLGDRELLRKKAMFPGYIDPISPLGHDQGMLETLLRYSEWDLPVFVMVMALAGGTAPASLAGLLVQQNAEILSSAVIARCVTKTPKIVYGSVSCPLDMRSAIASTGSPEFSLIGVGSVQMAKFYRLPSDVGAQSDSKIVDAQTSYEKMQSALMATMSGADFADLFLGSTETFNAFSLVQLMIDDEIASYVQRISSGIEVNEETLSVDVIAKTGPLGNYLKHSRTIKQFRREHSQAKLSDRSTRRRWTAIGAKDIKERARERAAALLRSHVPDPLEPDIKKRLNGLIREYTKDYDVDKLSHPGSQSRSESSSS